MSTHIGSQMKLVVIKRRKLIFELAFLTVILGLINGIVFFIDSNPRHLLVGGVCVGIGLAYMALVTMVTGSMVTGSDVRPDLT